MKVNFLVIILVSVCLFGCGDRKAVKAPRIDAALAFELTSRAAAMTPRHSGTAGAAKQANFIAATARKYGADVEVDEFQALTPEGEMTFRNVVATIDGENNRYLLVGCHYDAKKMLSVPDFAAANDGASGVGLLLAAIKAVSESAQKPHYSLRFVFFDGEECFYQYGKNDGLFGSKYYCNKLKMSGDLKKCRALILVDMVGDKDLKITLPTGSDKELAELCFKSAKKLGYEKYFTWYSGDILDDHTPFQEAGVPAIDLIDFEFGPENSYWHTEEDTMDKVSADSLKIVGDTVLEMIYNIK